MMKAMLSQPMAGKTEEEIKETRESNSSIAGERVRDCEHPFY